MLKNKELELFDTEIEKLENLVSKTIVENEIIKLNIKKKELLLKKYQFSEIKGYN